MITVGDVDGERNGFDPASMLTEWETADRGAPRKYYRITDAGRRAFAERAERWRRFRERIDDLIGPAGIRGGRK